MGPGGFNEYSEDGNQQSPELARSVNEMISEVAHSPGVTFFNAHDLMAAQPGDVYLRQSHKWSLRGHQIISQEIGSLIANEIIGCSVSAQFKSA